MDKISKAYKKWYINEWVKTLVWRIPCLALVGALFIVSALMPFEGQVVFWAAVICLPIVIVLFAAEFIFCCFFKVNQFKKLIESIAEPERQRFLDDFAEAEGENGRYYLSQFLLFFPYGGAMIRYERITSVDVAEDGVKLTAGDTEMILQTDKKEDKKAICAKIKEKL